MAERISKPDDIYIVVTHYKIIYVNPLGGVKSSHNFFFYAGTKKQLEELHLPKSQIIAVRLSPLFLRSELRGLINKNKLKIGNIGYRVYGSEKGNFAETNAYYPKGDVDPIFDAHNRSRRGDAQIKLSGIGAYLEAICMNHLHKNYGVQQFKTPVDSEFRRANQLEKGNLQKGKNYSRKEWGLGLGKIIRRRINIPK